MNNNITQVNQIDKEYINNIKNIFYKESMKKDPNKTTPDHKMCRYAALFLSKIINKDLTDHWYVVGGSVWPPFYQSGGFKDKNGEWHGHYWVTNGDIIIDIATKQFGEDEIIITKSNDSRYEKNYTHDEIKRDLKYVSRTVSLWINSTKNKTKNRLKF